MQISVTEILVRWKLIAVAVCVLAGAATNAFAQLRFAGPENQLRTPPPGLTAEDGALPPESGDEDSRSPVAAAQFTPVVPDGPGSMDLAPQVPLPSGEANLSPTDLAPAPPAFSEGSAGGELTADPTTLPPPISGEVIEGDLFGSPFDPGLVEDETAILFSTNAWFRRGLWYTQQDVVVLLRTESEDVVVSYDSQAARLGGGSSRVMLTTKTVDPTYVPGTRLTVGRFLGQDVANRDYTMEFSFLGFFDYSQSAALVGTLATAVVNDRGNTDPSDDILRPGPDVDSILGPGGLFFDNGVTQTIGGPTVPAFGDARRHDIRYDSDFNNFEVNFRVLGRPLRDRLALQPNGTWVRHAAASRLKSFLFGMRVVSINELFLYQASHIDRVTQGTYQVQTSNDLFGFHVGGDATENYADWSFGLRFKFGALFNWADRRSKQHTNIRGTERLLNEHVTDENLAGVVEAGLMFSYQVRPNLAIRGAYDALYITGLATAVENLGITDAFPAFEVTGDALFHGASIGVEMLW